MSAQVEEGQDVQWPGGLAKPGLRGSQVLRSVALLLMLSAGLAVFALTQANDHAVRATDGVTTNATVNFCDPHFGGAFYCTVTFSLNGRTYTSSLQNSTSPMSAGTPITVVVDKSNPSVVELPSMFSTGATFLGLAVGPGIAVMVASLLILGGWIALIIRLSRSGRMATAQGAMFVSGLRPPVPVRPTSRQSLPTRWQGMSRFTRVALLIVAAWIVVVLTVTGVLVATGHHFGSSPDKLAVAGPSGLSAAGSDALEVPAGALTLSQAGTLSAGLSTTVLAADGYEAGAMRVWENSDGRATLQLVMDQFDSATGAHAFVGALSARMEGHDGPYGPQSDPPTSDPSVPGGSILTFGGSEDSTSVVLAEVESGPDTSVNHVVMIVTARGFGGDAGYGLAVDVASRQFQEL